MIETVTYLSYSEFRANVESQGYHRARHAETTDLKPGQSANLTNWVKMVPCPVCQTKGTYLTRWRETHGPDSRWSVTCKRCAHTHEVKLGT